MDKIPHDLPHALLRQTSRSRPAGELTSVLEMLRSPQQRARAAQERGSAAGLHSAQDIFSEPSTPTAPNLEVSSAIPEDICGFLRRAKAQTHKPVAQGVRRSPSSTLKAGAPTAMRLLRSTLQGPIVGPELHGRALEILHCHSLFCQIGLPYRKPADDVREFERSNGNMRLKITAGEAMHPETGEFVKVGLPWGAKVRLVQIYLESVAVTTGSPIIETNHSLTAFITDKLRLSNPGGRTILAVKDALARLAASRFLFGVHRPAEKRAQTFKGDVIKNFDIWLPKEPNQRVLFPSCIEFHPEYFAELVEHAVPLKFSAVAALSHNTMALDCYRWLAQRLHRIRPQEPVLLFWSLIFDQFSSSRELRLTDFRVNFKNALAQALSQYPEANGKVLIDNEMLQSLCKDGRGIWLHYAPPPVAKKHFSVSRLL